MAPVGLAVSHTAGDAPPRWRLLTQPLRTPVAVACGLGVLVAATGVDLPSLVREPVKLTAALAVPAALLAYGMSLHGAPRPASGDSAPGCGSPWSQALVQPALAYGLGRWVAGLLGVALLAVTVTSALPTAQNVFVYASSYDRGTLLARDVVLLTTVLSVPVLVGIAVLLG
ncbi:MAG: AEC family transporter [Micromonospora sp.]